VPFVLYIILYGELWSGDLKVLRDSAEHWCREVAGARVHGTTRRVPREVFETDEQQRLLPAPTTPFDVPRWSSPKVHPDHHVQVLHALYSVPTRFIGKTLRARVDQKTVRLYLQGELVKSHQRVEAGGRATDPSDYPVGKAPYATRSLDALLVRARAQGEHVGQYAEQLLSGALPWTRMRQVYGLLRLCERYGAADVDALCKRSLAFDVLDVPRVERMLRSAQRAVESAQEGRVVRLPSSRFARDRASFVTMQTKGGE
jgi:hypothetical protein